MPSWDTDNSWGMKERYIILSKVCILGTLFPFAGIPPSQYTELLPIVSRYFDRRWRKYLSKEYRRKGVILP